MISRAFFAYFMVTLMFLGGCQGTGQVVNFDLQAIQAHSTQDEASRDDSLIIAVDSFNDARQGKTRIGTRTHLWGGVTHFNAWNGKIGEGMATLGLEYLKQRHWNAIRTSGGHTSNPNPPDVTLSGQVLSFDARAKSGFGFTKMDVTLKVQFEATNAIDGTTVRMILGSNGTDTVAFFDPDDMRELTNQVIKELFDQLFRDLTVKIERSVSRPKNLERKGKYRSISLAAEPLNRSAFFISRVTYTLDRFTPFECETRRMNLCCKQDWGTREFPVAPFFLHSHRRPGVAP